MGIQPRFPHGFPHGVFGWIPIWGSIRKHRIKVIKIRTKFDVIDTKTIKSTCVFINLPEIQYLCKLPNLLFY